MPLGASYVIECAPQRAVLVTEGFALVQISGGRTATKTAARAAVEQGTPGRLDRLDPALEAARKERR